MDAGTATVLGGATVAVTTLVIGVAVGGLAKVLRPSAYPGGAVLAVLLATLGAWIGGFLVRQVGVQSGGLYAGSLVGAVVLLALFRFYRRNRVGAGLRPSTAR